MSSFFMTYIINILAHLQQDMLKYTLYFLIHRQFFGKIYVYIVDINSIKKDLEEKMHNMSHY